MCPHSALPGTQELKHMKQLILLPLLSVIGVMAVFLVVAAASRTRVEVARKKTLKFLQDWADVAPEALRGVITSLLGFTGGFALVVALTFGLDRLSDATMPFWSHGFGYFRKPLVTWSAAHNAEWKKFRKKLENEWKAEHPTMGWDDYKDVNKWQVRAARTLFYYSLLLLLAGIIDTTSKRFRRRGVTVMVIAVVAGFTCLLVWTHRKDQYIGEVLQTNATLEHPAPLPKSLPEDFHF